MTQPCVTVELTDDLRTIALDHVVNYWGGNERVETALREWPTGDALSTAFRIEADMIHAVVCALRVRSYDV